MRTLIVEDCKNDGLKLTKYILDTFPSLSRNILHKALRNKDIKLNSKRISKDLVIYNNDSIVIYIDDKFLYNLPDKIQYIYTDKNILIAYKPQGILSNNKTNKITEPTFEDLVKKDFKNARICHRLDRNTAGLLIFALNNTIFDEIINEFKKGNISKEYIAYVANYKFNTNHEILENYILKDSKTGFSKIFDNQVKGSKKIITEYTVLKTSKKYDYAILKVKIPTGKTHQIRVQLKDIGHPIIGDSKYGHNLINKKFNVYKQLLFAYKYSFSISKYSSLNYLNGKVFELPSDIYIKNIGECYEF